MSAEGNVVRFTVPGAVVSKSNYRFNPNRKGREKWKKVKAYEDRVGYSALKNGAKIRGQVTMRLVLWNQKTDVDNALKSCLDGLRGVAYEDDSPKHLRSVRVEAKEDEGEARVDFEIRYGKGA